MRYSPNVHNMMYNWLRTTQGYYYTMFTHTYKGLTAKEVTYRKELAKSDINEYYHIKGTGYFLEPLKETYDLGIKHETYYVKKSAYYMGKVTINVQQVKDKFNVTIVYASRNIRPRTERVLYQHVAKRVRDRQRNRLSGRKVRYRYGSYKSYE